MEELQKRNTDCVYFLASPLTCKKGVECEYRHSEMARLNPRDCWYWLAGNCLKPTCAFRHPPLDGRPEVSSGSAPPHHQSTAPVNKATVPCYFYYNGFCNKGDWCPFLHGPDDTSSALKSSKTASAVIESLPLEKKTSAGSDTGIAPIKTCPSLCEVASSEAAEVQIKPNEELMQSILNNVAEGIDSPHVLASVCKESAESDENAAVGSDSLLFAEGCIQTRSFVCAEQSSEDPEDDHVERDELLESSPGFDVLVDGHSENLGYENDPEFVLGLDKDGGDLNGQYFGYEYEDAAGYDTAYADAGALYDEKFHNSYDPLDAEHTCEYVRNYHCIPRERMMDHILPLKTKPLSMELAFDGQLGFDLRDYLKKRRLTEDLSGKHFSRRVESSHLINQSRKRARGQGTQRLHQRLAVQQESSIVKSFFQPIGLSNGANKRGRSRCSHINRSRQRHFKEKRWNKDHFLSDISRNSSSNKRSAEKSVIYWGPKTRNQIKQEKRKSHEIGSPFGNVGSSSTTLLEDFQSPKPLSEILKDKRRLNSVVNRNSSSS